MFSSPTRFSTGTFTSVKNTEFTSCVPARLPSAVMIGSTEMPGVFMSISRKEMPSCGLPSFEVRTRQKIQSAVCASVVQVFWPLTM